MDNLPNEMNEWSWSKFFLAVQSDPSISSVCIVSYNYDIWLERLLDLLDIPFELPLVNSNPIAKFKIFKPHGSISFVHKTKLMSEAFSINYNSFSTDGSLSDIDYSLTDINYHTPVNFIIPPAGESNRGVNTWAQTIRGECLAQVKKCEDTDLAIVCGLSYWHVDRAEIDTILNSMKPSVELIHLNPFPSKTLDAVLNSLFTKYTHFTSSETLAEYIV